ncbi:hypothetical protein ACQKWADRAFT_306375 [Trichoderma austrokoningii]
MQARKLSRHYMVYHATAMFQATSAIAACTAIHSAAQCSRPLFSGDARPQAPNFRHFPATRTSTSSHLQLHTTPIHDGLHLNHDTAHIRSTCVTFIITLIIAYTPLRQFTSRLYITPLRQLQSSRL